MAPDPEGYHFQPLGKGILIISQNASCGPYNRLQHYYSNAQSQMTHRDDLFDGHLHHYRQVNHGVSRFM